jgi:hypothetical protein
MDDVNNNLNEAPSGTKPKKLPYLNKQKTKKKLHLHRNEREYKLGSIKAPYLL